VTVAAVRIERVALTPRQGMLAAGLDLPKPSSVVEGYTLRLEGWAVGSQEEVTSLTVRHGGRPVAEGVAVDRPRPEVATSFENATPDQRCGFSFSLGTLALPTSFEIDLEAQTAAGARFRIGTIGATRDPIESEYSPELQPLVLNALGRSGTTWMASLLGAHPQIGAFEPTAHDARLGTYWATVLQELSQPRSYLTPFAPQGLASRRWWLGDGGVKEPSSPSLEAWLGSRLPVSLASMCQAQIDAFYLANTDVDTEASPAYFVEKFVPRQPALTLLEELYPGSREVILVRDFRDVLCSILAFNRKRGFQAFGRARVTSDAEYVTTNLRNSAQALLERWQTHREDAHLVRYEDLIRDPQGCLRGVLAHLGLAADAETVDAMVARAAERGSPGHRTTDDAHASVGRWKRDLPSQLQAVCEDALGPALTGFGYEPSPPPGGTAGGVDRS